MLLPKDPKDDKNIVIELRAGTGGDEAALFVAEMFRLYLRFCGAAPLEGAGAFGIGDGHWEWAEGSDGYF